MYQHSPQGMRLHPLGLQKCEFGHFNLDYCHVKVFIGNIRTAVARHLSIGGITGGIVAVILSLVLIGIGVVLFIRRRAHKILYYKKHVRSDNYSNTERYSPALHSPIPSISSRSFKLRRR